MKGLVPVASVAAVLGLVTLLGPSVRADETRRTDPRPRPGVPTDQDALVARAFSKERTQARRRALARALGDGAVVFLASGKENGGEAREHRASRDFLYLTGIQDPGCYLLLDGERSVLFAPPRNRAQEVWNGEKVYPGEATAERFGVDEARSTETWKGALRQACEGKKVLHVGGLEGSDGIPQEIKTERVSGAIGRLRQVKDEDEVAVLRRAAEISAAGMREVPKAIGDGRFEFEVQGAFEGLCRFYGAEAQGYPSIVGSGPNSCILHYSKNRRAMKAGELLLIDAAGECGGYSADVTRTFPVSGTFTDEQRRVYEAVLRAQDAGIAECRVGGSIKTVNDAARAVLREAGLGSLMPHGVSHWLGLDVHDAGDYARAFEPGMVLTVEPGAYMADKGLGVRIEDDILVTEEGPVNLSAWAPRTVAAVEALMRAAQASGLDPAPLPEPKPLPRLRVRKGRLY